MITPNFADLLEVDTPKEKYLLSTCSSSKETKYGRRVSGIMVKSLNGTLGRLPKLIECDHIPQERDPNPVYDEEFPSMTLPTRSHRWMMMRRSKSSLAT
jgi:hypothetical protein